MRNKPKRHYRDFTFLLILAAGAAVAVLITLSTYCSSGVISVHPNPFK